MAAKKSKREKPPRAKAVSVLPDITIDEAFQLVVEHGKAPYPDRVLVNAFADGEVPLWVGDNRVSPSFFADSLTVLAKPDDATGRFHAEIAATRSLERPASSYDWRTSAKAVANFLAGRRDLD